MRRFLKVLAYAATALGIGAAGVAIAARMSDGPIGPFAGGALTTGPLVNEREIDWSFAADIGQIEFQLAQPPRSRTAWIVVHRGELYIPCGAPNFRLFKQWPHEAMIDGRATLRIEGKRYERYAVRVTEPGLLGEIGQLLAAKYELPEDEEWGPDDLWIFHMRAPQQAPRS